MKRLFGLIGITYLSVLVIVFYFSNPYIIMLLSSVSVIPIGLGIFFKVIKKQRRIRLSLIAFGVSVLCATLPIILYTNYNYNPTIDNYSYKEVKISGYLCEEVQKTERSCKYIIFADELDGKSENVKIQMTSYFDLTLDEFERINMTMKLYPVDNGYMLSKGIFLRAFADENVTIEKTGEKIFSFYNYAIDVRKTMKQSLDTLLPDTYSSLCKAVLLGDKQALSYDVKSYFTLTGTTYLIVVSGMHLSILVAFILILLKKITSNKLVVFVSVVIISFMFMTITGFTPSVVRAGVMTMITYCSVVLLRRSDALNSLGIAAIVLTLTNPYAVGDMGMLLSFVATMGIVLWSEPIYKYLKTKLHLKNKYLCSAVNMIAVSISASLWVMPISVLVFGTISPLVIVVGFVTSPIISAILILSLISTLFYLIPFINFLAYPFALVTGLLCKLQIWIISGFSSLPFCSVKAQATYFYIWIAVSVILVVVGYIIKAKSFYIKTSIVVSVIALISGWSVYVLFGYNTTVIKVYNNEYGVTATVESGYNISLISCGGSSDNEFEIIEDISERYSNIDNIIIPEQKYRYSKYLYSLLCEFDVSNILVYDNNSQSEYEHFDGYERNRFTDNVSFTVNLNSNTSDEIINVDGATFQYIKSGAKTLLFVPVNADIFNLPEKYRKADYLLIDELPENYDLLDCKEVVFSGSKMYYEKNKNSIKEISNTTITNINSDVILVF